jgi:Flp pilus assembly protein protease CpaA
VLIALWLAGVYFSLVDFRSHRIPNKALFVFFSALLIIAMVQNRQIYFSYAIIALILGTSLSVFAGLGFGDVKLLTIIALFVVAPTRLDIAQFFFGLTIASMVTLILVAVRAGNLRSSIPIAPSIFAGAILSATLT